VTIHESIQNVWLCDTIKEDITAIIILWLHWQWKDTYHSLAKLKDKSSSSHLHLQLACCVCGCRHIPCQGSVKHHFAYLSFCGSKRLSPPNWAPAIRGLPGLCSCQPIQSNLESKEEEVWWPSLLLGAPTPSRLRTVRARGGAYRP
jgi:hypothetical protein